MRLPVWGSHSFGKAFAFLACLLAALLTFDVLADHWPAWRGPSGLGVSSEHNLPTRWSRTEGVRWRVPLPDRGNSTPVVWGNRVFVTQAIEKDSRRTVMCFDKKTGKLLWQSGVTYDEKEASHATNPYCSASAVTDGDRVIASFGSAGLISYDFQGKEEWHKDLGKQSHIWGNGASPMLYKELCILNFGPGPRTFLIAVDKRTGRTAWKVEEPGGDFGDKSEQWKGSWSTPVAITFHGRDELILPFPNRVAAFEPLSGKELWSCGGLNPLVYTSALFSEGIVVAMGGFNGTSLAVKAGGDGDVTATHRIWQTPKTKQRIGSGVVSEGYIYILDDPGIAECIELMTGKIVWQERLEGPSKELTSWSSLVLAEGKLYGINQGGDTFVLRASPKFELLGVNPLGEMVNASLAASDGDFFIRTHQNLWCIGNAKAN